jgi:dTDP-4-amino-4,6-dideoxygalactose transaminase
MRVPQARLAVDDVATIEAVTKVLRSGRFIGGDEVERFAERWANYCVTRHCVPTASGSAALAACIRALSTKDDTILVPAFSFAATTAVLWETGRRPVYCDVTPDGLMDWNMAEDLIKHVQGIMPVHLYGQLSVIPDVIKTKVFYIIEDACQAHGIYGGGPTLQGDVACYSFYPSKNLGAAGDAGAVVTNRDDIAEYVAMWINYGDRPGHKYEHRVPGTNARMDAIQAAFLNNQLCVLGENNTIRANVVRQYRSEAVMSIATAERCVWHLYPILATEPDELIKRMSGLGVEVGRHYPYPLWKVLYDGSDRDFPVADKLAQHVVTLPIGPHVTSADARYVADSLKEVSQMDDEGMWRLM